MLAGILVPALDGMYICGEGGTNGGCASGDGGRFGCMHCAAYIEDGGSPLSCLCGECAAF